MLLEPTLCYPFANKNESYKLLVILLTCSTMKSRFAAKREFN